MRFALVFLEKYHRQLLSLGVSLLCALVVQDWYINSEISVQREDAGSLVAKLVELKNEVQRRPPRRLTWQNLRNAESLFEGEQVRTQDDSWARLEIPDGGGFIYVEPSSLISLNRRGDSLVLDFLKGNVFVSGSEGANLKVTAEGREIQLNGADLVLEKKAGEKAKAHVTSGKVDGVEQLQDPFLPVGPVPYAKLYLAPEDFISWNWKKPVAPGAKIKLLTGASRDLLSPVPMKLTSANQLRARLANGEYFWQLAAVDAAGKEQRSQIYFLKVVDKLPVQPILPADKSTLSLGEAKQTFTFAFENPAALEDVKLQLAASRDFAKPLGSIAATEDGFLQVPLTAPGTYYGRYIGTVPGSRELLAGRAIEFIVQRDDPVPKKPDLLKPASNAKVEIDLDGDLAFAWSPSPGAAAYKFELKNLDTGKKKELLSSAPALTLPGMEEGSYEWRVVALAKPTKKRGALEVPSDSGAFRLAYSLLNPPDFTDGQGAVLTSNARGEASFTWKAVQKAKAYEVELIDAAGKVVHGAETDGTKSSVKKLKPGNYTVRVTSIDKKGRRGPASTAKHLLVPNRSDLKAPKILNVEVEE